MSRRIMSWAASLLLVSTMLGCSGSTEKKGQNASPTPRRSESTPAPGDSPLPSPAPFKGWLIKFTVKEGQVTPKHPSVEVKAGDAVRVEVTADVDDEIHVHAYDKKTPVKPGETAVLEFTADIPGSFEVELERSGTGLFELRVK